MAKNREDLKVTVDYQPIKSNFFEASLKASREERETGLCCCEYIDRDDKKFHLLGCCCNCEDFDTVFTNFITCRNFENNRFQNMLLTFQDRLRLPWRGGAKQVSPMILIPIIFIPLIIAIAAINLYTTLILVFASTGFMMYLHHIISKSNARTRFFTMWLFWSVFYMLILFEWTVPLLELLPEEHLVLVLLFVATIGMMWRTKHHATANHVLQSLICEDELPGITEATAAEEEAAEAAQTSLLLEQDANGGEQVNVCSQCHKYMPPRTDHCYVCGVCIMRKDHHSFWLDCCIGEHNHRYYIAALYLGLLTLLLGANLTLTAVCHPFLVIRMLNVPVMLPDDCSEVYDDYELGLSFVNAVYSLTMALYLLFLLVRQIHLISRGITLQECRRGQCANRKTFLSNWRAFIF